MKTEVQRDIDSAIQQGKQIRIHAYGIISATEKVLSYISEKLLDHYGRPDLLAPVYTSVKELALNGAKANIKHILFEELSIDMDNEAEYEKGMKIFKENLNEQWVFQYALKARESKHYVDIIFNHNPDRVVIEVLNNRPISGKENERIRSKFRKAMGYDDIAQFYMEGGDGSEGAGMGIVLVTMMLKAQGIDPHLFTIRSNQRDLTVAKVEIPLHESYSTSRERFDGEITVG